MLYAFGFERIGVVLSDIYFMDPRSPEGQEGAEQGVRLEVRFIAKEELKGSVYSAQPISINEAIWRGDLLESVENSGSFDRTHHHPRFRGWEPTRRHFVEELSADPFEWVSERLSNLDLLLEEANIEKEQVAPTDGAELRRAVPEIIEATRRVLERIRAGELGQAPAEPTPAGARIGWL